VAIKSSLGRNLINWTREVEVLLKISTDALIHPNIVKAYTADKRKLVLGILFYWKLYYCTN
jgi:hypothetical protein